MDQPGSSGDHLQKTYPVKLFEEWKVWVGHLGMHTTKFAVKNFVEQHLGVAVQLKPLVKINPFPKGSHKGPLGPHGGPAP